MTIHLITAGKYQNQKDWPEIWNKCFESIAKTKNDICVWDDEGIEKLLKEDDEEFYNKYLNNLDPIYMWDCVRYIILERYGGAYFDMDIELITDFFPLLDPNSVYFAEGTSGNYIENCIMISSNGENSSPIFFERIKDFCKDKIMLNYEKCLKDRRRVLYTTGARALSEFIITQLQFFPVNFNRLSYEHFGSLENTLSFAKHYHSNTWLN